MTSNTEPAMASADRTHINDPEIAKDENGLGLNSGEYKLDESILPGPKDDSAVTATSDKASHEEDDVLLVDWDGPDDKANPKNWTYGQKWTGTVLVSVFTFLSPVSSSMVAPASEQVASELGITSPVLIAMSTSVFVLGYGEPFRLFTLLFINALLNPFKAFGPLVIGPLSEIYGRSRVLQISYLFFLAWNLGCGFATNKGQLIAFRFLAGLGGGAPLSIGGGVLGDTWHPEERGKAIAIYSLAPLLGPVHVVGPVCGGWISKGTTWRWVFWSTSIADVVVQVLGLFFLRETFAPYLLQEKAKRIQKQMDLEKVPYRRVLSVYETKEDRHWKTIFKIALTRPFMLFINEPIVQLLGVYMGYLYGVFYLFLTTIPAIYGGVYREDVGIAGLHYISLGLGLTFAAQVNARALDALYKYYKKKNDGVGEPEFRLPSMIPGTILMPFGLLLAGWSAQHRLHWIATDIGIACVGAGVILNFQAIQTYVVDSFTRYAASALAAVSFIRSIGGFTFPLFAPAMYQQLGYGKGNTVLACASIGIGCPAPILFWKYGKRIRMSSRYARNLICKDSRISVNMITKMLPRKSARSPTATNSLMFAEKNSTEAKSSAEVDIENQPGPRSLASHESSHDSESDLLVVDWDGPDDKTNPKNWTNREKWTATLIVSAFTFISPVSSSMVAPASAQLAGEFGITSTPIIAMMTSVFVLGYAFGPLILGPLSEIYGRSRVLQLANIFYMAWNLGCGFAKNENQLIAFRFLSGLGGSAPLSIGGGVMGDTWHPEERGRAIAIYSLAPLLGPVIGPICGGWIAERSTWRWVFWSTSIVNVIIVVVGFLFLKETFAPYILQQKADRIQKEMGTEKGPYKEVTTVYAAKEDRRWQSIFQKALTRPFMLFYYEPIVQLLGIFMAYVYGVFYLFLTTIPAIFRDIYHEEVGVGGLHYIALGIGLFLASQFNGIALDGLYRYFKKRNNGVGEPEFRLPAMIPGTILMPFGVLLAGWSAQHHLHWIATDIGIACVGAGLILNFQAIQTYAVDSFTLHAASALAAISFLRSVAGFGFPLFAPIMFERLGYGKGNTILACVSIGIGCPAPILFWKYGKRIRMSSRYAYKPEEKAGSQ
ncbi:hypothetical protein CVT24_013142 [Panaeolus cyanescens]|uniref:Major facilitator superfamily (MFS) profile domain-containing protein n=1 Tax=Panaeolus cyanescens TaxID=181874 RepID=A0A409VVU7_9AGAR|nr:hypothetical protein CVT24_013142 [Panaeolus cyanescens]